MQSSAGRGEILKKDSLRRKRVAEGRDEGKFTLPVDKPDNHFDNHIFMWEAKEKFYVKYWHCRAAERGVLKG